MSCYLGARYGGYSDAFVAAAATYGRHLGIAYQIYDDLTDFFGDEKKIGKTLGTDLASGKITLPLEALLARLPGAERAELIDEITGRRPPQPALRIQQMSALGVFDAVVSAVAEELGHGEAALAPFAAEPPTLPLMRLGAVLRQQVAVLRSGA